MNCDTYDICNRNKSLQRRKNRRKVHLAQDVEEDGCTEIGNMKYGWISSTLKRRLEVLE